MVEVKNLVKKYGDHTALDNVSFTAEAGEILGFLGPNGAGKSTTMNIITGYISSTSGTVTVDGCEILDDPTGAKSKIGYLPEIPPLYIDMTVRKYLEFMFNLKKVRLPKKEHIDEVCAVVKIKDVQNRLIKNLSKGYKQRVGLAQALLGNPPVLILDEPTVGLDPKQIIEMRNLIKGLGKKHTVILSSHVLSEVQATCDRVIIINQGKLVADSKTSSLSDTLSSSSSLLLRVIGSPSGVMSALKAVEGVVRVEKGAQVSEDGCYEYVITTDKDNDPSKGIFYAMAKNNSPIVLMRSNELSLEEAFLRVTEPVASVSRKGGKR
ncbi:MULTISPECIES: ABC transporter ATP-binding protein [unclassified Ruminococcus]|uniref:ABC transporter ATP-binding protein n=1 Tax=unclassified Ruminococcus TaxID=2608920 RepID=UPI00210E1384|nr:MULTISPECIES: ATP-binding cassette domain-containing protein [unclassified Ruminococcus]MCQ4021443.1 ATP-binding cassette domain-containing protein [Ruminococcus sp. zg-924]MCQ4113888.1 ATP-binding cassette domain-containing protein [Ruminococcus sp. zg-921]